MKNKKKQIFFIAYRIRVYSDTYVVGEDDFRIKHAGTSNYRHTHCEKKKN